ncbi:MAG TPA: response regulator [Methylomirabilota bacterium]|nr:response regulator [Methylomirabilota bacterium]
MNDETPRVLLVEDDRDTTALLRDLLEAEGYVVDAVATGEAAFEALERTPDPDLLVLDLMLPGMSGYDVIERLRGEPELGRIPILVLSALSSPSARIRGLRDGADDYMTKPFLPEELIARARTLVTGRLLERRTREIQALGQITQASLTAASVEQMLQRIVEILGEVFSADVAAVLLADETHAELRAGAATGTGGDLAGLTLPLREGVGAEISKSRAPLVIEDGVAADPGVTSPALRRAGIRSLVVAPLVVAGTALGVVEVARRSRRVDPRAGRLLQMIADRIAVAIQRARAEGEARELADVVRRIGEGVVVADAGDGVVFANRAFGEMVGTTAESLTGCRWTDFLSPAQDIEALTAQMRLSGFHGELLLITAGGEPRPVHLTLSTVERAQGGPQRIGIFRDISREHELRFRVIREQKFRTLGSLAAGVAHNINNRLTPVLGWTEMLLERLGNGEAVDRDELTHALRVIHQGAADSVGTVRRLQEYSRPARVKGPEAVALREVVEQLLALTRPQWDNEAARRGVRYEIALRIEPAPPILAVASEIREALLNILENAFAAMPDGGRLTIEIRGQDDRAVVAVSDTGRGMSAEVQRVAFEPFFTTRASEGGSGLGLSLAQEIVQRYGGSIAVQSREGAGTTFTLSFPSVSADGTRVAAFLPVLEPLRVLVVEDEPEVLDLVRAVLAHAGHAVLAAASGREAVTLFGREPVDLVITDLGMPGMTGTALAAELKRLRRVPVVLLTGWADELDRDSTPDVDVILAKPFSREQFFAALARAVPGRVRSS